MPQALFTPPENEVEELTPSFENSFAPPADQVEEIDPSAAAIYAKYPDMRPDTSVGAFARGLKSKALAGLGGLAGGAAAGALVPGLGETGVSEAAGGLIGLGLGLAGATTGGAAGEWINEKLMGKEGLEREKAQLELNRLSGHEFAGGSGQMVSELLPAMRGGGQAKTILGKMGHAAESFARMGGAGEAAHQVETGQFDPAALVTHPLESAITGAPLGLVPGMSLGAKYFGRPAAEVLGSVLGKAPADAAVLTLSGQLYNHYVHGQPLSLEGITDETGKAIPGFMLLNALTGIAHLPIAVRSAQAQHAVTTAADSAEAAGMPQTAQALRDVAARAATPPPTRPRPSSSEVDLVEPEAAIEEVPPEALPSPEIVAEPPEVQESIPASVVETPTGEQENAIPITSPEGEVLRDGEAGRNLPGDLEGMGTGDGGQEIAQAPAPEEAQAQIAPAEEPQNQVSPEVLRGTSVEQSVEPPVAQPLSPVEELPPDGERLSPVVSDAPTDPPSTLRGGKGIPVEMGKPGYRVTDEAANDDYAKNGGWKLHLAVDPQNYKAVDEWLAANHKGQYKLLQGGDPGESDFTVYVGAKDDAKGLAEKIKGGIGDLLLDKNETNLASDTALNSKVSARFDVQKTGSLKDVPWQNYGSEGIPYDEAAGQSGFGSKTRDEFLKSTELHRRRIDRELAAKYGERYTGRGEPPGKTSQLVTESSQSGNSPPEPPSPELAGGKPAEVLDFTRVPHSELSREDAKRLTAVQIFLGMAPRSRGLGILASVFAPRPKGEVAEDAGRGGDVPRPVGSAVLDTIRAFEQATGRKVSFIGASDGRRLVDDAGRPLFSALSPIGFPDTIYINKDAPRHLLALIGHEWGHTVDTTDPALYHAFKKEVLRQLGPEALEAMREDRRQAGYTEAQLDEEVVSNIIGDAFLDPAFWRKLQEHDRPLWQKMVDSVTRWINSLFDKVRKSEFGTTEVLRNVEETHQAIIDLMNGSNKEPGKLPHRPIAGIDYSKEEPPAEPPSPPNEPPAPPAEDAPPEKVAGFYNAAMDAERERRGMELAERAPYTSVEDLHSAAHRELVADPTKPERILDEFEDNQRPLTAEEDALLRQYGVELQMQLDAAPEGDPRSAAVYDKLDRLLRSQILSGSYQGQAFRMRQTLLNQQFDVAGLAKRWMAITGKSLTPDEWAHIRKEAAEFKDLNEADKQAAYSRLKKASQDEIERLHEEVKSQEEASDNWLDDALEALDESDRTTVDAVLGEVRFLQELATQAAASGIKFSAERDEHVAANRARDDAARARVAALGALTPEVVARAKAEASAKLAKLRKTFADPAAAAAIDKAVGGDRQALKLLESLKQPKARTAKPVDAVRRRFAEEARKPGPVEKFVADLSAAGVSKENAEKLHAEALKKAARLTKERAARQKVRQAVADTEPEESAPPSLDEITQSLSKAGTDLQKVPVSLLRDAVRSLVASGLRGDEQVMPELTKLVNTAGIKATEEQVRERAVNYGHAPTPLQTEPDKSTREALAEALKVASIKRVESKQPVLKTGQQRDKPHQKLRELFKVLKDKMKAAGIVPRTSEQQLATVEDATLTRLRNDIEDLQAQIDAGARATRDRLPVAHTQKFLDEQAQLKAQRQKLVEALDSIDPAKPQTPEEREARLIRAAERSADHWRERLKNAEWEDRAKPGPPSEKVLAARENAAHMKELFEQARDLARPDLKKDPEALALARYNRLLDRREADLARRVRDKDYSKPVRNTTVLDDATAKRKIEFERKLRRFNADARDAAHQNKPASERFWDFLVKMKRSFVLTYPAVIGKLTAASLTRGFTTVGEELAGGAMGRLLPSDFTTGKNRARIEGGVLKAAGYVEAAKNWHMKWIDDMKKTFAVGESDLDTLNGKEPHEKPDIWGLPGRIHAAIKAPIKRALYEFAMAKQIQSYLEDGHDPADLRDGELLHMRMAANAYKYAERGIFLQDNALVKGFNGFVRSMEADKGIAGPGIARLARIIMPIVKVPTNIIAESFQMVGGLPVGLVRLARAWHAGFDKLDADERESILRTMKKGSLGAGLVLFGYYSNNPAFQAGGYYNHDDKHKPGDPKVGGFKIFGVDIPRWLTHAPAFEAIQFGATIRRAMNNTKHGSALPAATGAALLGLAEETPFLNEMFRIKDLQTETGRGKFFAELAKAQIEPGMIQQAAQWSDRARPLEPQDLLTGDGTQARHPNGFTEILKSGVPGLRQQLSYKVDSPFSPRRTEQIPEVLHQYAQNGNPMPSLPERAPLEKKLGHPLTNPVWNAYTDIRGRAIERLMLHDLPFLSSPADEKEKKRHVMDIAARATHEARQALGLQ